MNWRSMWWIWWQSYHIAECLATIAAFFANRSSFQFLRTFQDWRQWLKTWVLVCLLTITPMESGLGKKNPSSRRNWGLFSTEHSKRETGNLIYCSCIRRLSIHQYYRSGTVNSNTVNSKFHLIRSYCEYLATILSFHVQNARLIRTQLIRSSTNSK